MTKEKYNHIIDEAYENYCKSFENQSTIEQYSFDTDPMSQLMFIEKIKFNQWFSDKWGLKIEERALSLEERSKIWNETHNPAGNIYTHSQYNENNLPTKLITITHENEIIEVYE